MANAVTHAQIPSPADRTALAFILGMNLNKVALPLRHDRSNCGTILDAEGNGIIVIDMHRERPDDHVMAIAELVVVAINTHAGLMAEIA